MAEPTYASPSSRSTAAILAFYVAVGVCLMVVGADVRRIAVAGQLRDGRATVDELLSADQLVTLTTVLALAVVVAAVVLFLRWQVAAHRNLAALGHDGSPVGVGAGAAAWFVPGLNFVLPFRVACELWRSGDSGGRVPGLLRVWWAAWVVALLAVVASRVLLGEAVDVADRQRIDTLRAAATVLAGVAAGLTIAVVTVITARQEARAVSVSAPRAAPRAMGDGSDATGGLRVISEEQARREL